MSLARDLLVDHPIVPVVVIDDAGVVGELLDALAQGGIRCAEITLRTPAGLASITAASRSGSTVGAGTVLTADDLRASVDAGARFIVSPGLDDALVALAHDLGVAVLPGVATATEIQRAITLGLDTVKFFPADRLGGVETIRALAGPFPRVGFVPSGGVTPTNALEYLDCDAVPAISGSWMATRALIAAGRFDDIARLSLEITTAVASR